MNRDAKIGIVVILVIVCALVIIVGRGSNDDMEESEFATTGGRKADPGPIANSIDILPTGAGSSIDEAILAVSPSGGTRSASGIAVDGASIIPTRPPAEAITVEPPVTPPPVPAPAPRNWTYAVAGGDTLIHIARDQLGNERRWPEIAKLNNLADPSALSVGQKLTMPPKETGAEAAAPVEAVIAEPVASGNFRKYRVQNGDSLTLIAREQLNDGTLWKKIADINKLAKPYKLEPGQVILLPR